MKKYLYLFLILGIATAPQIATAFNDGATINAGVAYYEADDECAVETEFTSFQGGGNIFGTEGLYVNGALWGDMSQLPTSGYQVGDKISWGTEALSIKWNYDFDVTLRADLCIGLKLGDQISYRGSAGTDLTSYDITQEPMIMGAYTYNDINATYEYQDLNTVRLSITSLDGSTIFFGGGQPPSTQNGGGNGNGGCSFTSLPGSAAPLGTWFGLMGWLSLLVWRRFRV